MSCRIYIPAEYRARALSILLYVGILVHLHVVVVSAQRSIPSWQNLSGEAPLVIARGGFSGLLTDSSYYAYNEAIITDLPNTNLWCDVQLTKDGVGICFPDLRLDSSSDIYLNKDYQNERKIHTVNGISTSGWFAADYTFDFLKANVSLYQRTASRNSYYYGYKIMDVDNVLKVFYNSAIWLNIQHDTFYSQLNMSMRAFVLARANQTAVSHISSPEVAFLQSLVTQVKQKLVFRFLQQDETEVWTSQTYGSLLINLTFIKTFASGILVPKSYIWQVDRSNYLPSQTSLVQNAHKQGLEVYVTDFENDFEFSYNYRYDLIAEYQSFVDNGKSYIFSSLYIISSNDLLESTNVFQSPYSNLSTSIPEAGDGIYTFSLTRSQIQSLKKEADKREIVVMHAYKLALMWPPQYCFKLKHIERKKPKRCVKDYKKDMFMIHGLWPMDAKENSLRSHCQPGGITPYKDRLKDKIVEGTELYKEIYKNWKDLTSEDPYSFWQHEWDKHGKCSKFPTDPAAYFKFTTEQAKKYKVLEILRKGGIIPNDNSTYRLSDVSKALKSTMNVTVEIHCDIAEVRICMNPDGKLIDCSSQSTGCKEGSSILFRLKD